MMSLDRLAGLQMPVRKASNITITLIIFALIVPQDLLDRMVFITIAITDLAEEDLNSILGLVVRVEGKADLGLASAILGGSLQRK